ncbi:MAG: nucleotidyltransferase domain-containing protein [Chlorobi bacterium]|nr:nucleotidyltransferase domain-containing protein [Chlorobiota bacterium]
MDQKEVVEKVRLYKKLIEQHFPGGVDVYLFGSYAKNTFSEDSDIDVAIVVDKIEGDFFKINPLLWKFRRRIDDRIEPILIEKEHDDGSFLDEIIRMGIAV